MCVCYLDLAGSLDVVDGVESLLHRLPQSNNAMISQHQDLNIDIHVGKNNTIHLVSFSHSETRRHKELRQLQ